jgi:hypothetical protein
MALPRDTAVGIAIVWEILGNLFVKSVTSEPMRSAGKRIRLVNFVKQIKDPITM